jgi:hypothetical protein
VIGRRCAIIQPADFRRLLVHVICRPHRDRTLAADRRPLNRPVTCSHNIVDAARRRKGLKLAAH